MSYLRYLCVFTYSGVPHILRCIIALFCFVLCVFTYSGVPHILRCIIALFCFVLCTFLIALSVFFNVYSV